MEFVINVFPHKLDEQLNNIFFHILAISWVEPYLIGEKKKKIGEKILTSD